MTENDPETIATPSAANAVIAGMMLRRGGLEGCVTGIIGGVTRACGAHETAFGGVRWFRRQVIYAKAELSLRDRLRAAQDIAGSGFQNALATHVIATSAIH